MRFRISAGFVALLLVAGTALAGGGKIQWGTDHDKALAEAKTTGKPIMMFFTSDT